MTELQETQAGEDHDKKEAEKRNTPFGAVAEEFGRMALERQPVKATSRAVSISVTGREDGCDQESVDQVGKTTDAEILHGNDIRRGCRGAAASLAAGQNGDQFLIIVRDQNADGKSADDEENAESPVNGLEGILDVNPGPSGFGRDHGDVLGTDDGEGG